MAETSILTWNIINTGGMKMRVKAYYDAPAYTKYICDADPGTSLSSAKWKVRKIVEDSSGNFLDSYVAGGGEYNQPATDLTTVQGLSYS